LLRDALRAGISAPEFWELTPVETFMSIEASVWREERRQQAALTAAWVTAKLSRAKRIPPLKRLLKSKPRRLSKAELARRGEEFKEMSRNIDLEAINRRGKNDQIR
jgi:hypothetical protein